MVKKILSIIAVITLPLFSQEAPTGSVATMKPDEKKRLAEIRGTIEGFIVWSSSRSNSKHDIWIMDADGSNQRQLTSGDNVDWYPRIAPAGNRILFTRSKSGWVPEGDAEMFDKWDLWIVTIDGTGQKKVADDATWGTWRPAGDSIVFARGPRVYLKDLASGNETLLFDATEKIKKGAYAQQPQLSPDGKKLALTVRGSKRETGIWNRSTSTWYSTGEGCQMEWFSGSNKIMRMNEGQGNGGTEVLLFDLDDSGKPIDKISGVSIPKKLRFMDLSGRRSHEYFPKVDKNAQWLVWCATQYGHEHDIADYEVYLWKIGSDKKKDPVRLTFHTGNDRWPDIYVGKPTLASPAVKPTSFDTGTNTHVPQAGSPKPAETDTTKLPVNDSVSVTGQHPGVSNP